MRLRTLLAFVCAVVFGFVSASCEDNSSGSGGVPSEYQTVDEFMGWGASAAEAEYQAFVDLRNRIEDMRVECMAGHGLEYAPREADPGSRPLLGEGLSEVEFMAQYGYGIITNVMDEARWNAKYPPDEVGADPDTLWGEFTDDLDTYMAVLDECGTQIEEELGRPDPGIAEELVASIDEVWSPLESELEETQRRMERDSRFRAAEETWSACLSGYGHDFDTANDIESYLTDKLGEFEESANYGTLVFTDAIETDLQPLVDEELAIAAADLACRGDLDRVRNELRREYEGLFIDEYREQLEEVRQRDQQLKEILLQGWQW